MSPRGKSTDRGLSDPREHRFRIALECASARASPAVALAPNTPLNPRIRGCTRFPRVPRGPGLCWRVFRMSKQPRNPNAVFGRFPRRMLVAELPTGTVERRDISNASEPAPRTMPATLPDPPPRLPVRALGEVRPRRTLGRHAPSPRRPLTAPGWSTVRQPGPVGVDALDRDAAVSDGTAPRRGLPARRADPRRGPAAERAAGRSSRWCRRESPPPAPSSTPKPSARGRKAASTEPALERLRRTDAAGEPSPAGGPVLAGMFRLAERRSID